MSYVLLMTGAEFIKRIRLLGKCRNIPVSFDIRRGKGSHGTLHYGDHKTIVKDRKKEIGPGLLNKMLVQLGLTKNEFR